jgi:hypothetical protein
MSVNSAQFKYKLHWGKYEEKCFFCYWSIVVFELFEGFGLRPNWCRANLCFTNRS